MKKTVSRMLFGIVVAATLAACTTAPVATNDQAQVCRETGLTNARDSKMGQLECSPVAAPAKTTAS